MYWKRPTRPTEHKNAHPRTARASSHPPRSLETARSFSRSSGVHGVPRWRAARRTRPPASSADVARAHSSAIGARVMARVIDVGGSRPAFEPRSSSADAVDVMLDPKEEVRLGGTRAFPRGHSPRARARAHQILFLSGNRRSVAPRSRARPLGSAGKSRARGLLPGRHAHPQPGRYGGAGRRRPELVRRPPPRPPSFPRSRVASDVSFSSSSPRDPRAPRDSPKNPSRSKATREKGNERTG